MLIYSVVNILIFIFIPETLGIFYVYEYGKRVGGDLPIGNHTGKVPMFLTPYALNLKHNNPGMQKMYTYIRVEYINPVSYVKVNYDVKKQIMTFVVKLPVIDWYYAIFPYALPATVTNVEHVTRQGPVSEQGPVSKQGPHTSAPGTGVTKL